MAHATRHGGSCCHIRLPCRRAAGDGKSSFPRSGVKTEQRLVTGASVGLSRCEQRLECFAGLRRLPVFRDRDH